MDLEQRDRSETGENYIPGLVEDLAADHLLPLAEGERYWKLYVFRPSSGRETGLEHRIYTKIKPDGGLAMVTFAVHTPAGGRPVRSGIARVPDMPPDALDRIIDAIRRETQTGLRESIEIDLSELAGVEEQLTYLKSYRGSAPGSGRQLCS